MRLAFSNEDFPEGELKRKEKHSVFLAGPSPGQSGQKSWRIEGIRLLKEAGYTGLVLIPEGRPAIEEEKGPNFWNYHNQVDWEYAGLEEAALVAFWVPRKLNLFPGFTTNIEFGRYVSVKTDRVLYGRPKGSDKTKYLDWLYAKVTRGLQEPVFETLEELVNAIVAREKLFLQQRKNDMGLSPPQLVTQSTVTR
jgi:hypothetical protein